MYLKFRSAGLYDPMSSAVYMASNSTPRRSLLVFEAVVIDVGQDSELVVLFEILQRVGRIGKRRPLFYRLTISGALIGRDGDAPFFGDAFIYDCEEFGIARSRRPGLLC